MRAVAQSDGAREDRSFASFSPIIRGACVGLVALMCSGLGPPPRASLRWHAPSECPQAESVGAKLGVLLRESASETAVDAEAQILRLRDRRYRLKLHLVVGSHRAERTLESDSCDELASTAAWLIAVAIDPTVHDHAATAEAATAEAASVSETASETPQSGEPGLRPDESVSVARPDAAAAREPLREEGPRARASLRPRIGRGALLAGVSFGTAGPAQAVLGGAGGLGLGWLYSELALVVLLPRREELTSGAVVTSWSLDLGLRECALWGSRLRWGPCLTLDGLRTVGRAQGIAATPDQALFWAVAGVALRAIWQVRDGLELSLAGGFGLPVSPRPRFTVEGIGDVAQVSAVPGYLQIGVGFATR